MANRIELEYAVFGREKKRADIVIFDKQQTSSPYIIVEMKKPKLKDGKEQLKSYCNATGAPIGVWTNGDFGSFSLAISSEGQETAAKVTAKIITNTKITFRLETAFRSAAFLAIRNTTFLATVVQQEWQQ